MAFLHDFLNWLIGFFMSPGRSIMHSIAAQSWGKGVPPENTLYIFFAAALFWVILFSILGSMEDQIRRFLNRNNKSRK